MAQNLLTALSPELERAARQFGFLTQFNAQPQVFNLGLHPITGGAAADSDIAATLVGVIPHASRLIGGYVAQSANSTGIDANNTSVWVLSVGGTTYMTLTRTTNFVADTPVSLGTPAKTDCAAGTAVKLAITNGTNANQAGAICYGTLVLADQDNFPAPGWGVIATDGGTVTVADAAGGAVALSPGSADNDEIYLYRELEDLKWASGKGGVLEGYIQFSEANTDDANIGFGMKDAVAANSLVDDGAGPATSFSGAVIHKVDGGTKWKFTTSLSTTQTTSTSTTTAGGTSYQRLTIEWRVVSSTVVEVTPFVDGVQLIDSTSGDPIKHRVTYTNATEMQAFFACKNGGANAETLNVKYAGCEALR